MFEIQIKDLTQKPAVWRLEENVEKRKQPFWLIYKTIFNMFHITLQHFCLPRRDVKKKSHLRVSKQRDVAAAAAPKTLPLSCSAADSCPGGPLLRSQSSICELQVLNYYEPSWGELPPSATPPQPHPPVTPTSNPPTHRDQDQELFQRPPLLRSTKHNFNHRTSQPAAPDSSHVRTLCTRTGFSLLHQKPWRTGVTSCHWDVWFVKW